MARKNRLPVDMSSVLKSSKGTLAQIKEKTNSLTLIADIVRQICPDLPVEAWKIGNISNDTLYIEVKSAAWSQRFQFERNTIIRALQQQNNSSINNLEIKVSPFNNKVIQEKPLPEKSQFISAKTASQLLEVAEGAPEGLKQTLERLAKLAKQKP